MKKPGPITNTREIKTTRDNDVAMSDVNTLKTVNEYGLAINDLSDKEVGANPNRDVENNPRRNRRRDSNGNGTRKGSNIINGSGGLVTSGRKRHDGAPTRQEGSRGSGIGNSNRNLERKWADNLSGETPGRENTEIGVLEPVEDSSSSGSLDANVETDERGTKGRNVTSDQLGRSNFRSAGHNRTAGKTGIGSSRRGEEPKGGDEPMGEKEIDNFL